METQELREEMAREENDMRWYQSSENIMAWHDDGRGDRGDSAPERTEIERMHSSARDHPRESVFE